MGESRITNVYARALFESARDAGTLEATGRDLAAFTSAMRESRELTAVLFNPQVDSATKKRIVSSLTEGADRIFQNGIKLMIDKRHPTLIMDLHGQYQDLLKKEKHLVEVEITTAVPLPEETLAKVRSRIEQTSGKQVEIREKVDEGIIGGLVLRFGDLIVDGSLKAKLHQLRASMIQA
ncbi:MAG: ATP synthase F1 subunit delta [Thermoleophilia bacterium]|nr:ATP synthase F1 subunit delta [Thermoleophilia bacterium]